MKKIFLCGIVLLVLSAFYVSAATINAASCSYNDVLAAITSAQSGDTVNVPAGSCTWSSDISVQKKVFIEGAGMMSTVITANSGAFDLGYSGAHVGNIGFRSSSDIAIIVKGSGWRIHHCKFESTGGSKIVMIQPQSNTGGSYVLAGLIDHCEFKDCRIYVRGSLANWDESEQQHESWTQSAELGKFDTVYIEDCKFDTKYGGNLFDADMAGAYVARFNTMNGGVFEMHSLYQDMRGTRKWEVYHNTISNSYSSLYYPFRVRAGTGVVFNNVATGNWDNLAVGLDNVRSYDSTPDRCDGSSPLDGNELGKSGYPCRDQIGRGPDNPRWDDNPLVRTFTQPLLPVYAWGNTEDFEVIANGISRTHIQANRDYYNRVASFTGTSGMGSGPVGNRPSSCTPNTAYWATDEGGNWNTINSAANDGKLYKCTALNVWTEFYTPYTYPHPLASGSSPPPPPAAVPGDLNGDSKVDISDLVIVATNFGRTSGFDVRANVVSSSPEVIDISDLSFVARRFTG